MLNSELDKPMICEAERGDGLLLALQRRARGGSKPRCHLLTHGQRSDVSCRLNTLAEPFASVAPSDTWMPDGFDDIAEAQLHAAPKLLHDRTGASLRSWWLARPHPLAATPNIDIASTCSIGGRPGLLLVEAKAYDRELIESEAGKTPPTSNASADPIDNHMRIAEAIAEANRGLRDATGLRWALARDICYQMSNRFAWAWKLSDLGFPVVLVYLGFLNAAEMADLGTPLANREHWERLVVAHSDHLFSPDAWGRQRPIGRGSITPLIRSVVQPLALA